MKKLPSPLKPLKNNNSGMAILLVLSFILMITFIAKELALESRVEYEFSNISYKELKAYHAAKSGVELSLFRILLFQMTKEQFGENVPDKSMLDMIWSFPMQWPPQLGEDASLIAKEDLKDIKADSLQDATWFASISPEGSKIDLNDLDSPSEALQQAIKKQIVQLIRNRLEAEDAWADENGNLNPEEIVNHMIDYIDKDDESQQGGNEGSYYENNSVDSPLPPNRMFRTMDELLRIPGMDQTLYAHLAPNFSLYGIRAININAASKEVLMSIDPQITEEVAKSILDQISNPDEGPFKSEDDFINFISRDVDTGSFNPDKIPLVFQEESAFRITSEGSFKNTIRSITAVTFNVENVTKTLENTLKKEALAKTEQDPEANPPQTEQQQNPQTGQGKESESPKTEQKRPLVVIWEEQ